MKIDAIRTPGLGDATYILEHGTTSIVVDPQRDIERFMDALGGRPVRMVLETHLHNDYVSGAGSLADATGAELILPAAAAPAYRHTPAFHLEDLDAGDFVVRPIHTPGHTPEHTSYLVIIDGVPAAVFSGGSLLVGSAGRPDLLGDARADSLARLQYISVNRLGALPGDVELLPTHGEGSFCTASGAGRDTSTIGAERASNPVLQHADVDSFVAEQLGGLQPYPAYYAHMGPANTFGFPARPSTPPPVLTAAEMADLDGVSIIDIRHRDRFAAGHIPGAIGLEMGDQVGVWAGWLLPLDARLVLVADADQDLGEAVAQFRRIGMDSIEGIFTDMPGWVEAGREVASYRNVDVAEFTTAVAGGTPQILDVRGPSEFAAGSLDGARWAYLPDLVADPGGTMDQGEPVWIACGSGYRATAAAGLLEAAGYEPVVLSTGGVPNVRAALAEGA